MKNIQNMFFAVLSSIALFNGSLSASSAPTGSFDPVIEIYNKDKESIQVNVTDLKTKRPILTAYVSPGKQWNSGTQAIDMANTLLFTILKQNQVVAEYVIHSLGTKYVTWNPSKSPALYTQTGPLMGFMGKTESGLSLKNNVRSGAIQEKLAPRPSRTVSR